jgi:serine/threonine-protein kinase ULK/ATG1
MLVLGRAGAVDELMGNFDAAVVAYGKASALLYFLMVEAPAVPLVPPLVLRSMDRLRLRRYASSIAARHAVCAAAATAPRALPPAFGSAGNLQALKSLHRKNAHAF